MRGEIVALDLETTGLDPTSDEIIEIGAALCKDDTVVATFQSFVKPRSDIPYRVTALTGITNADVRGARSMSQIAPELHDFIGDRPLLGHNIAFDQGFLRQAGLVRHNPAIDTYELAAMLLPTAPRYNLASLIQQFDLTLENAHRALEDAIASHQIYRIFWGKLFQLDLDLLKEIVELSSNLEWSAKLPIQEALKTRLESGEILKGYPDFTDSFDQAFPPLNPQDLRQNDNPRPLNIEQLSELIGPDGALAQQMEDYESRPSQIDMTKKVSQAFNKGQHLMIEAPTGTGKSLAYLLPAVSWAVQNQERVVISTHTISLQDQLMDKDIPFLKESLNLNFNSNVMKGRANYLCPRRLDTLRRRAPTSIEELRVLAKTLVWLSEGGTGIKAGINLRGPAENSMWNRLSAQDEDCSSERCLAEMGGICPFYQARQQAEHAHILIVNHALLLSDVATGNRVLPPYDHLVLDEGHHLEDAITESMANRADKYSMIRRLADFGGQRSGLLGDLLSEIEPIIPGKAYRTLRDYVLIMEDAIEKMAQPIHDFFDELARVIESNEHEQGGNDYNTIVRITDDARHKAGWGRIQKRWKALSQYTEAMSLAMSKVHEGMESLVRYREDIESFDSLMTSLRSAAEYLDTTHHLLATFVDNPTPNMVYWVEIRRTEYDFVVIQSAPLHVGVLVERHLWDNKRSIILTSATLQTDNSFNYIDDRLNANNMAHASVASPFDYKSSTMVYLPTDIPEPNQRQEYQAMMEAGIVELARVSQGRMLCLFTSYTQLRDTANNIAPLLARDGIIVYDQSAGSSRQILLDSFKTTEKAVLMGTRSFWEGIDIPGQDLSVVVIARLPFSVPSDPLFAARSETYGDQSFVGYSVPEAILRFRQGFGRLIRRATDRGVVVIFDKRVTSKRYGRTFIDSLPDVTLQKGTVAALPEVAARWLGKDKP
jgi:ATP-dependent DNA helicase DinG